MNSGNLRVLRAEEFPPRPWQSQNAMSGNGRESRVILRMVTAPVTEMPMLFTRELNMCRCIKEHYRNTRLLEMALLIKKMDADMCGLHGGGQCSIL